MKIYTEAFFYKGIVKFLKEVVEDCAKKKEEYYSPIEITKKAGVRTIYCLDSESILYKLQENLATNFLSNIPIAENVYGFVKNYSYKNYLEKHTGKWKEGEIYYIRLDITDFFGSIKVEHIKDVFKKYFATNNSKIDNDLLEHFLSLVTYKESLPQGAITSPAISNIVFRQLDCRIQKYCDKLNITYSRYADDMLFSTYNKKVYENMFFVNMIRQILASKKFYLNESKTIKRKGEISLGGFVIGGSVRLSRAKLHDLGTVLFVYKQMGKFKCINDFLNKLNSCNFKTRKRNGSNNDAPFFKNKNDLLNYLVGYRSFLISWLDNDRQSNSYRKLIRYISEISELIYTVEAAA